MTHDEPPGTRFTKGREAAGLFKCRTTDRPLRPRQVSMVAMSFQDSELGFCAHWIAKDDRKRAKAIHAALKSDAV